MTAQTMRTLDPPVTLDWSEWMAWGAAAYDVPGEMMLALRCRPSKSNLSPLAVRASTGRWDDFWGTSLSYPTESLATCLRAADEAARGHLVLLPRMRFWTAALAVQAWQAGLVNPGEFPRDGWYSPADAATVREWCGPEILWDDGLRAQLRLLCRTYREFAGKPCAVEGQIAAVYRSLEAR